MPRIVYPTPTPSNSSELVTRVGWLGGRCSCFLPGLVGWRAKGS